MSEKKLVVSSPHMGSYHVVFDFLFKRLFKGADVVFTSGVTNKTLELGTLHSPEFVCVPFKYTLGNALEAIEMGANLIVNAGGSGDCRVCLYSELQEKIFRDMGHDVLFVNPFSENHFNPNPMDAMRIMRKAGANAGFLSSIRSALIAVNMLKGIDKIEDYMRANEGFEVVPGSFSKLHEEYLNTLKNVKSLTGARGAYKKYLKRFKALQINKPANPIRVLIVGEVYVVMEPASNFYMEKQLAKLGIEVRRDVTFTKLMTATLKKRQKARKYAEKYLEYDITGDGLTSVATALEVARKGYDGVIHLKPFGCLPEVSAMPMLNNITLDTGMPVLFFSFDSQTSETGVKTRLEAFYDMICMKREAKI